MTKFLPFAKISNQVVQLHLTPPHTQRYMSPPLPPRPAKTLVVTPSEPPPLPARHSLASVLQEQPERTASPVPSIEHERDYVPIESNATQPLDAPTTLFAERSLSDDPQGVLIHLIAQKHPPETLEGKILRESVEAEEIRRYMDNFHKVSVRIMEMTT
jgi:hypothetical protein